MRSTSSSAATTKIPASTASARRGSIARMRACMLRTQFTPIKVPPGRGAGVVRKDDPGSAFRTTPNPRPGRCAGRPAVRISLPWPTGRQAPRQTRAPSRCSRCSPTPTRSGSGRRAALRSLRLGARQPAWAVGRGYGVREARIGLARVARLLLDPGAVAERDLVHRVRAAVDVLLDVLAGAGGEHDAGAVPGPEDDVLRLGRAVDVVPLPQRPLLALDDQERLARQHEEALLVCLPVVHPDRLARLEHEQVDAELREVLPRLVVVPAGEGQAVAASLAAAPARVACVQYEPARALRRESCLGLLEPGLGDHGRRIEPKPAQAMPNDATSATKGPARRPTATSSPGTTARPESGRSISPARLMATAATPAAQTTGARPPRRNSVTPEATAVSAARRSSTSISAIDCQALCVERASVPATVTSMLYQGMKSDSASTRPPSTASPPRSLGQPLMRPDCKASGGCHRGSRGELEAGRDLLEDAQHRLGGGRAVAAGERGRGDAPGGWLAAQRADHGVVPDVRQGQPRQQ